MLLNLVYAAALMLLSPILLYGAIRHGKYRSGWSQKLWGMVPRFDRQKPTSKSERIWIHAVSVGEVNLAEGLARRLNAAKPGLEIVVSTTTVTGFQLATKRFPASNVFYCPMDFTWAIHRAIHRIAPDLIVLIELEIWPNWLRMASRRRIPVAVVNGRLSENSFRGYQRIKPLLRKTFGRVSLVAAQDDTYAERFRAMGVPDQAVRTIGSLKFDDAPLTRQTDQIARFKKLANVQPTHAVFVAGSTQAGEETIALQAFRGLGGQFPQLRLIIVPRHAERFESVAEEIEKQGFRCLRRSHIPDLESESADTLSRDHTDITWAADEVLLIDTIGELRGWWGLSHIALVGGSLGKRGGQNMLEPCGYGAAVCFGPNTRNFRDIVAELLDAQAARVVHDVNSLQAFISDVMKNPHVANRMGAAAQTLIRKHQGAGQRTVDLLLGLLVDNASPDTNKNQANHDRHADQTARPNRDAFEHQ